MLKKIDFARANGGWTKNTLLVAATIVAGSIVSIPQAACSELSSGFEPAYVSGSNYKLFYLTLRFYCLIYSYFYSNAKSARFEII